MHSLIVHLLTDSKMYFSSVVLQFIINKLMRNQYGAINRQKLAIPDGLLNVNGALICLRKFLLTESPLQIVKNVFQFILNHSFLKHLFSSLCKHQKTLQFSYIFTRWRKGASGTNGLKAIFNFCSEFLVMQENGLVRKLR